MIVRDIDAWITDQQDSVRADWWLRWSGSSQILALALARLACVQRGSYGVATRTQRNSARCLMGAKLPTY